MGIRYFKTRIVEPVDTSSVGVYTSGGDITDLPSGSTDFASIANLFDMYRVCAIKLKFIPTVTASASPGGISAPFGFVPMYVIHDTNSITEPVTAVINYLQYESCRVMNAQRPWTYYRRMARNIPTNSSWTAQRNINTRGWIPTDSPITTQGIFVRFEPGGTSAQKYGTIVVTHYLVARARL